MKSAVQVRNISNSALLSYVYFNPIFRVTRVVRKKLRRQMTSRMRVDRLRVY